MRTKTPDRTRLPRATAARAGFGSAFPVTVAYWLEDDLGNRISKLFGTTDKPLRLAARALESVGSLAGWTVARRDAAGVRQVVASGPDLEAMATPFMPLRTPTEAAALTRLNDARRAIGFRRASVEIDERVY